MSNYPSKYFRFSGHSLGAAALFHQLDEVQNLNHTIPTLGASVLAPTGGLAQASVKNYAYTVDQPRKRTLLSVRKVETAAHGRDLGDRYETEVEAGVEELRVVDKLSIGYLRLHFLSTRAADSDDAVSVLTTKGSRIEGLQLGNVKAVVNLDEEPLLQRLALRAGCHAGMHGRPLRRAQVLAGARDPPLRAGNRNAADFSRRLHYSLEGFR
jgi:hypothetical protein